jgi:hypothetical protein
VPHLTVISDPITCERRVTYELRTGETLAHALMRLWPHGLDGKWRIYREMIAETYELAAVDLPYTVVIDDDIYLIVLGMGTAAFLLANPAVAVGLEHAAFALGLSLAMQALTPKPPRHRPDDPDFISSNNLIAGQTNTLRPGARVPDILGRVRAYPDLLCSPVDVYSEANQTIGQMFVIGMGDYEVDDTTIKLGETPITSIQGARLDVYPSGDVVPPFYVMKPSREVGEVSLLSGDEGKITITGSTDFVAASHQMRTDVAIPVALGKPVTITGTFFNNAVFWIDGIPPATQTSPPFIYTLDGPVADETGAAAQFTPMTARIQLSRKVYYGKGVQFSWPTPDDATEPDPPKQEQVQFAYGWPGKDLIPTVGDYIEFRTKTGQVFRGRITRTGWPAGGRAAYWALTMSDLNGNKIIFPSISGSDSTVNEWIPEDPGGAPNNPDDKLNAPTNWYAAPMSNPQEIWLDIAFPQGLAFYDHGSRKTLAVVVRADFRRKGQTDPEASVTFPPFAYATATPMRFTKRVTVAALGLPASEFIEVRLQRVTAYLADSSNNQYVQDTRWVRLAAVRQLIGQTYTHVTVAQLTMSNTRSTSAIHDMALNAIVTRKLPTWDGSAMTTEKLATRKWADNFVQRCLATDGANRAPAQLDLPGIYQIQQTLDSLDKPSATEPGKLGEISMTLDQVQDIDAELSQIADVARAVVYRVGRKLFVARDQANAHPIALFNARTKSAEAETVSVRMTADADNDCVVITWVDELLGWKQRDYRYPEDALAINPLRVAAVCANWQQARRRALFEWAKLKYRRKQLQVSVTEDGRIVRPGDVINVTDDIATLATCAGEVIDVAGATLTLDRDLVTDGGTTFVILLRDVAGILVDLVPCTPVAVPGNQVTLARSPSVAIKGRDSCMGTMFAFYRADAATVDPWLVLGLETAGPNVRIAATNYAPQVYDGDSATMPDRPPPPNLS